MAEAVLGGTAVASTAYTVKSYNEQKKASKAAEEANRLQRSQADLAEARRRREIVRQARMQRGQAQVAAENQGVAMSSSALGAEAAFNSQLTSNLSFLDTSQRIADAAEVKLGEAGRRTRKAQDYGFMAQLADKAGQYAFKQLGG